MFEVPVFFLTRLIVDSDPFGQFGKNTIGVANEVVISNRLGVNVVSLNEFNMI